MKTVTRPIHPPLDVPDNVSERAAYDARVDAWLTNAYAYVELHNDDDEIEQWVMEMETNEHHPHA